ncbi:peptide deformylase [Acholeplasma equirhinis]|uniref:peptide deformylase n=1 Tax=Acholeplasma equirhinis TaxID=555393 RepID=UPI001F08E1EC|nr:peptide deformylase [Acholeplasma equirhinis]
MITMQNIIREGHPTLTTKSKPVILPLSKEDIKLGKDLLEYVINSQDDEKVKKYRLRPSVGLAAPQVNKLKRMFAMHVQDLDGELYSFIIINPEIIGSTKEECFIPGGEGCLSVDRPTEGLTPRKYGIRFKGYTLDPETEHTQPIEMDLVGYPAIVFQHEFDHLDGIMFTTKLYKELPNAFPLFEVDEDSESNETETQE